MSVISTAQTTEQHGQHSELIVYAQDTLDQILGWYGLKTPGGVKPDVNCNLTSDSATTVGDERAQCDTVERPLDLTSSSLTSETPPICDHVHRTQQHSPAVKMRSSAGTHKKLVGIRYLFPPFDDRTTLLERARVWVARHDHRYFVDWTEAELATVDPSLRPYSPITREAYKLHMNRSEYCRNVKLKYCLMSEAPWAKAFREKLEKSPSEGGFTGLCQAKIAAAELWRAYSEHYRSHQARHPTNGRSYTFKQHSMSPVVQQPADQSTRAVADETDVDERPKSADVQRSEPKDPSDIDSCTSSVDVQPDKDEDGQKKHPDSSSSDELDRTTDNWRWMATNHSENDDDTSLGLPVRLVDEQRTDNDVIDVKQEMNSPSDKTQQSALFEFNKPLSTRSPSSSVDGPPSKTCKKSLVSRQQTTNISLDYRRSERGLSFLFPSFSDHGMSLIDKVRVTVARHKNNYFLGWTKEELDRLDPVVRPKIVVTPEIYREYCHRNAMKYDSNLQFACESPESWAVEFRSRLALSPADGGFSSLCEVKLEAGRLWREHSGRYRMHNIVKWQMGMNNAVLSNGLPTHTDVRTAKRKASPQKSTSQYDDVKLYKSSETQYPPLSAYQQPANGLTSSGPLFPLNDSAKNSSSSALNDLMVSSRRSFPVGSQLFAPLPKSLSVAEHVRIWLERHRAGYFIGARSPADCPLMFCSTDDLVKPTLWPVTVELFHSSVPSNIVHGLSAVDALMVCDSAGAVRFRDRLIASATSTDAFSSLDEAINEALVVHSQCAFCRTGHRNRSPSTDRQLPVDINHKYPDTSAVRCQSPVSNRLQSVSMNDIRQILWSCRQSLHAKCADNTSISWSQRLQPMLAILMSNLGNDYCVPDHSSSAIVDLVLATLQSRFETAD